MSPLASLPHLAVTKMFIPRNLVGAIVGTDPDEQESNNNMTGPADFNRPGPHRYIGVGMVLGLAFVVLVLWLKFASWPRRKASEYGCWRARPMEPEAVDDEKSDDRPQLVAADITVARPELARDSFKAGKRSSQRRARQLETQEVVNNAGVKLEYRVDWEIQHRLQNEIPAHNEVSLHGFSCGAKLTS